MLDFEEGFNESCCWVLLVVVLGGDGICGVEFEFVFFCWGFVVFGGVGLLWVVLVVLWLFFDGVIECCSFVGEMDGFRCVCVGFEGLIDIFMKVFGCLE